MTHVVSIIVKGGIVMIPLLACSLISLALTIERIMFWTQLKSKEVLGQILTLVEKGEFDQALKLGKSSGQPIARVLEAGLAHRDGSRRSGRDPVLKSRIGVLDTIVTLAPCSDCSARW